MLQTLALFETLVTKIQTMKIENGGLVSENNRLTSCLQTKCTVEDDLKQTQEKLTAVSEVFILQVVAQYSNIYIYT